MARDAQCLVSYMACLPLGVGSCLLAPQTKSSPALRPQKFSRAPNLSSLRVDRGSSDSPISGEVAGVRIQWWIQISAGHGAWYRAATQTSHVLGSQENGVPHSCG